jgi:hypothetical protein
MISGFSKYDLHSILPKNYGTEGPRNGDGIGAALRFSLVTRLLHFELPARKWVSFPQMMPL